MAQRAHAELIAGQAAPVARPLQRAGCMKPRIAPTVRIPWISVVAAVVVLGLAGLTSCNTTAGFGRDMQKVGDKIEDTANRRR
jgi:predicted small secreted protein